MAQVGGETGDWALGPSSTATQADVSEWIAYEQQVKQSLGRLTPDERRAVLMARFGYSYKEIASQMNISVRSLRNHLRRGYLTLKASAEEPEEEQPS